MTQLILDTECYSTYWLCSVMRLDDGRVKNFELYDGHPLDTYGLEQLLTTREIITFNGNSYDMLMIRYALTGVDCAQLKYLNDQIIEHDLKSREIEERYDLPELKVNTIDLMEVAAGKASLKIYGGRFHCEKMQDLPYDPSDIITPEMRTQLKHYCKNDLEVTKLLWDNLTQQVALRRNMSNQYGVDLRSKSDAQIAEAVIVAEIAKINGSKPMKQKVKSFDFLYETPEFISFSTNRMDKVLDIIDNQAFHVKANGRIDMPKDLAELQIKIGKSVYQLGMGGLHSTEKSAYYLSSPKRSIVDFDVASYYPAIILNCGLYPKHLGKAFLKIYKELVDTRLAAKKAGDKSTADSLRITINGSFGKLGSPYSALYSPELMIQVTVTGQLALLMLIDSLEEAGIPVVSANTDGIVCYCPSISQSLMHKIVKEWEALTNFNMESNEYTGLYSRDVNNYIAITTSGKVKTKGCFGSPGFQKNPSNEICNEALIAYLQTGVGFEEYIKSCRDIRKFVTVRQVKGGAVKGTTYLGKAVRWYYSVNNRSGINYKTNGNSVARSYGAKPLMDLPEEFPKDIDYNWYIKECWSLLNDIGVRPNGQLALF